MLKKFDIILSLLIVLSLVMMLFTTASTAATTFMYGDVNFDESVTSTDVLQTINYKVGKDFFTEAQILAADVNGDGIIDATDSLLILQYSVGKVTKFPAEDLIVDDPVIEEPPFVDTTPEVVEISSTNFPDGEFLFYVYNNFDLDEDWSLSEYEISKATNIAVGDYIEPCVYTGETRYKYYGITNFIGIEYFTELENLTCSGISLIGELDLSQNTKLKYLDCSCNPNLSSLNVSKNLLLKSLVCSDTAITEFDLSSNVNLESLTCYSNDIETLDLSYNTKLKYLYCSYTNITELDLSSNTELEHLFCKYTNLTSLDLTNNTKINWLFCDSDLEVIGYTK